MGKLKNYFIFTKTILIKASFGRMGNLFPPDPDFLIPDMDLIHFTAEPPPFGLLGLLFQLLQFGGGNSGTCSYLATNLKIKKN